MGAKAIAQIHIDKRRYPRRRFASIATVYGSKTIQAQAIELSEGGMMLRSKTKLSLSSIVLVHFTIPEGKIQAQGRVIYSKPTEENPDFDYIGIRFTNISELERLSIKKFVQAG
ncbi:MAG TPA: PilZ domain-containing protein [Bdellovibrionales bacterium]|nr:PilZ domain-containing protein [Bdellovibrionales bacterium]